MAIAYPASIDNFTNPTSSSPQNSPSHSQQHADANDAIEALEAKVGKDNSDVTSSHDYKIRALEGSVGDIQELLDGFSPDVTIADVDGLQAALDGKSDVGHDHDDRYYTEAEVDTLIAGAGGNPFNQDLNTGDAVSFAGLGVGTQSPSRTFSVQGSGNSYMSFMIADAEVMTVGSEPGVRPFLVFDPALGQYTLFQNMDGSFGFYGAVSAPSFSGDGAGITGVSHPGDNLSTFTDDIGIPTLPIALADIGDATGNIGQWTNDSGYIDAGGLTTATDFVWWDGSNLQPSSWGSVNVSLLNNDAGYTANGIGQGDLPLRRTLCIGTARICNPLHGARCLCHCLAMTPASSRTLPPTARSTHATTTMVCGHRWH